MNLLAGIEDKGSSWAMVEHKYTAGCSESFSGALPCHPHTRPDARHRPGLHISPPLRS